MDFPMDFPMDCCGFCSQELVPMTNYVDPVAANGAVEKWLVQVEDAMLESIRDQSFQWPGEEDL